jgi:RNA polymerase sigma-70 factor, ECF subfamily
MSLQHRTERVIHADPQTLFCAEFSQPMRIAMATSTQQEDETRADKGASGYPQTIDVGRQKIEPIKPQASVRDVMLAAVPRLRAFAISLSGSIDRADDLVQETLLRAMTSIDSFKPGTNMCAWLFTILRNFSRSEFRKRRREVEDADGSYLDSLQSPPEQHSRLEFKELSDALAKLPIVQREAVLLVAAAGFSYEDAAAICGTAVGTIKSRVNRARQRLAELLVIDS